MKQGKWICYPGDYEVFLAEKVNTKRFQRDFPIRPFWRVDSPWHHVRFFKNVVLEKPTKMKFSWEGSISVFFRRPTLHVDDVYSYEFTGELEVPAGEHYMEIWVYNPNGLPCLKIDSDSFVTDETFEASFNQIDTLPAGVCNCGNMTPNTYCLPTRPIQPVRVFDVDGEKVYDFGKLILGFTHFTGVGNYRLYFGETLAEATNDVSKVDLLADTPYFGKTKEQAADDFCEQIEIFTLAEGETHVSEISKAFRYLRVRGDRNFTLFVEEEYDPAPIPVKFTSENERLNKIFGTSVYTFSMCAREFYLDGAKRDRWLWGGDAYEAEKAEYYYQYDTERIKRSIVALFGKPPIARYINHIMDYTLYTVMSVWEYYEKTGDKAFLEYIEPTMTDHLEFCKKRLSEDGFLVSQKYKGQFVDWVFVDWGKLPDKNGEVSFEQILFWAALQAAANVYAALGKDNAETLAFAANLKDKINDVFWQNDRGMYAFARNNGVIDDTITCHANVFAVLYGFADEDKKKRITDAIKTDKIPLSITPFMIEFVLASLFEAGEYKNAAERLENYWGGMIDVGATTFWETYVDGEEEETATAMYGRPFGRSKCHIWGAGPLYLIPRYYFGIASEDFGERLVVKPQKTLIKNRSITVPTKRGTLTVSHDGGGVRVLSTHLDGVLYYNGQKYKIEKGVESYVEEI